MWNNDMFILWNHISAIFYEDRMLFYTSCQNFQLNIKLTTYSKMNVRLTAEVFSSASRVLLAYSSPEAAETARFCSLMD